MRGELESPGESSPRLSIGRSRLAQQRVCQCLLRASETEFQNYMLSDTAPETKAAAESAEDRKQRLAALRIGKRLRVAADCRRRLGAAALCSPSGFFINMLAVVSLAHTLLPHNTTCLRSPHNAMHSPSLQTVIRNLTTSEFNCSESIYEAHCHGIDEVVNS